MLGARSEFVPAIAGSIPILAHQHLPWNADGLQVGVRQFSFR